MTAFDITPLQIPIGAGGNMPPDIATCKMPIIYPVMTLIPGQEVNVGFLMEERKKLFDMDLNGPPFDDLRSFTFEGSGIIAESLSSLASGTDDENQDYNYLSGWGPQFNALTAMYVHHDRTKLTRKVTTNEAAIAAATATAVAVQGGATTNILAVATTAGTGARTTGMGRLVKTAAAVIQEENEDAEDGGNVAL
ncbi:putative neural-cadherin 2 [Rhagoletis pomonella]|nr:putative neural-cadherin 2 [Rhagoletis pomonella]